MVSTSILTDSTNGDPIVDRLERVRFQIYVIEARVREGDELTADLLSDLADEMSDSILAMKKGQV